MSICLNIFFLSLFSFFFFISNKALVDALLLNAAIQFVFFLIVAVIPFLRTKRMSYVDIAWPFGVSLIGFQIFLFADNLDVFTILAASAYLFIGLRMGFGAVVMGLKTGVIFKYDFPRYEYRKVKLAEEAVKYPNLHMLGEVFAQGFANATVLAMPGLLIMANPNSSIGLIEIVGIAVWVLGYSLESLSDTQKLVYISKGIKNGVCNIGLWKYSRHPNYFGEWLVWTGLALASIPSWVSFKSTEGFYVWLSMGLGVAGASAMLYITLVHLTGATPAEYYSVQKRPGYRAYQETTNRFFPWFPKKS
jgi:steroid 5-alpha reductase family enzyme